MTDNVTIRQSTADDVEGFDRLRRAVYPWHAASVAAQRNWFTSVPEAARNLSLCAVVDGEVVAFGSAGLNVTAATPGEGSINNMIVHPGHRGRGIAKRLLDRFEAHLREIGARRAQCYALDDPHTLRWVQRQGYELGASERWSMVDPRDLPPVPKTPPGVTVATLAQVGPKVAHEIDNGGFLDEPGDVANGEMPFDIWEARIWNSPDLDREVSLVALVDGVPAALTFLEVNRERGRAMSSGTCTLPQYRGRGLVKLLKSMSLRRAAEAGVTAAFTANDYSNAPMLAVNDWLGYRVIGSSRSVLKPL